MKSTINRRDDILYDRVLMTWNGLQTNESIPARGDKTMGNVKEYFIFLWL